MAGIHRRKQRNVLMTEIEKTESFPLDEQMLEHRKRLAVFGGSFDPVHVGHLFIAGEVLRHNRADEVLFVPARTPPHKPSTALLPAAVRLEMVRAAVAPYAGFSVSDLEITAGRSADYTIETMACLEGAFPDSEILFLMGMDSLNELHTWHRATELVTRYRILIHGRAGVRPPPLADMASEFGPRNANRLAAGMLNTDSMPVSSTRIREYARRGVCLAGLVPAEIEEIIHSRNLYRN